MVINRQAFVQGKGLHPYLKSPSFKAYAHVLSIRNALTCYPVTEVDMNMFVMTLFLDTMAGF